MKIQLSKLDKEILFYLNSQHSFVAQNKIISYLVIELHKGESSQSLNHYTDDLNQLARRGFIEKRKTSEISYKITEQGKDELLGKANLDFIMTSKDLSFENLGMLKRFLTDMLSFKVVIETSQGPISGLTFPVKTSIVLAMYNHAHPYRHSRFLPESVDDHEVMKCTKEDPDVCIIIERGHVNRMQIAKIQDVIHTHDRSLGNDIFKYKDNKYNFGFELPFVLSAGNEIYGSYIITELFDKELRDDSISAAKLKSNAFSWFWQKRRDEYVGVISKRVQNIVNAMFKVGGILL